MSELLARQRPDGLWSIYHGGEPDLNATIEAYAALRLAGCRPTTRSSPRRGASARSAAASAPRGSSRGCGSRSSGSGPGGSAPAPGRAGALRPWMPGLALHVRLLGAADGRAARRRHALPARSALPPAGRATSSISARSTAAGRNVWDDSTVCSRATPAACQPGARVALAGRALDHRSAGARRLLGRDPAAVGLVADRARLPRARARVALRAPRARRAGSGSWSRTATGSGPRRASRPVWDTGSRSSASAPPGCRPSIPPLAGPATGSSARRCGRAATGRSTPRCRARRLGLRVRQRPLPGRRRRRRRRPRAATSSALGGAGGRARLPLAGGDAVVERRLGRLRRRQRRLLALRHPVLRLRRRHRPAERRRHGARRRAARARARLRGRASGAASTTSSPSRSRTARGSGAGA